MNIFYSVRWTISENEVTWKGGTSKSGLKLSCAIITLRTRKITHFVESIQQKSSSHIAFHLFYFLLCSHNFFLTERQLIIGLSRYISVYMAQRVVHEHRLRLGLKPPNFPCLYMAVCLARAKNGTLSFFLPPFWYQSV